MATKRPRTDVIARKGGVPTQMGLNSGVDALLAAAMAHPEGHTGRYLAVYREGAQKEAQKMMTAAGGIRTASAADFGDHAVSFSSLDTSGALEFSNLGMALVSGDPSQMRAMAAGAASEDSPVIMVPEEISFASVDVKSYMKGFQAATNQIAKDLGDSVPVEGEPHSDEAAAAAGATWGLVATRVPASSFTGAGIRVAILDTGFDTGHPDFAGRPITAVSFIAGETPMDGNGHGTHTAGTACGPLTPRTAGVRYGIAHQSRMFIGKVLSNAGSGSWGGILAGINWAIQNNCQVISMSLGGRGAVSPAFTQAGQAALNRGCLIIAAAGNDNLSTGTPANSPTIMSVAALNQTLGKAVFSNFGKIEIAAPGVNVQSSLPRPRLRGSLNGTSMACPHVAGIAALHAQGRGLRGINLWRELQATARRLPLPPAQVGAGLVQA